jgi:hypothetical protein
VREQLGRVVPHPRDQVRASSPEEWEPENIESRDRGDATVVRDPAAAIEGSRVQPRIRGAVPGRPDHGGEPLEVDLRGYRTEAGRRRPVGPGDLAREPVLGDEVVDALEEARLLQIRVRRQAGEGAGELRHRAGHPHEPADEVDAGGGERVEVERHPGRVAD